MPSDYYAIDIQHRYLPAAPTSDFDLRLGNYKLAMNQDKGRTFNLSTCNVIRDLLCASAVNFATHTESSSEDLFHTTLEGLAQTLELHCSGNFNDFIERDVAAVLDVLLLFAIAGWFFEGTDDKR